MPPLTRIDHVLTSPGLAVAAIRTGEGLGSDHRPLVADVIPDVIRTDLAAVTRAFGR